MAHFWWEKTHSSAERVERKRHEVLDNERFASDCIFCHKALWISMWFVFVFFFFPLKPQLMQLGEIVGY